MPKPATFIPVPPLPKPIGGIWRVQSVQVVRVFDRIRRELEEKDANEFAEFCWFAREYPRIFRHHVDHAAFRLRAIHQRYIEAFGKLSVQVEASSNDLFETLYDDPHSRAIYYDFESFLSAVNCSLDALTRVVGTAYKEDVPVTFNKLCKTKLTGVADLLRQDQIKWAERLKTYRDCFVHSTPIDTVLPIVMRQYPNGWELRCPLPTNPKSRDITRFRYSRRTELLKYALSVWRRLLTMDRRTAAEIEQSYDAAQFPKKTEGLFCIGAKEGGQAIQRLPKASSETRL